MLKLRCGCFETNSSSTHAICIPAAGSLGSGYTKRFSVGRYGWENDDADADDYLYTAICERYEDDEEARQAALDKIRAVCAKHNIECDFIEPKWCKLSKDESRYLDSDDGYIDHCCEFYPLMDELFADEDLLYRYLSGAVVFTGNDNYDEDRIDEIIEDYESRGYYVYEKGN